MFIQLGREDVAEKLFKINVNVNLKNNDGYTVLHLAVQDGRATLVEGLIERSSDVNLQQMDGDTPLHIAVEKGILIEKSISTTWDHYGFIDNVSISF